MDWVLQQPAAMPSARTGAGIAYDAAHHEVVLFGGYSGTYDSGGGSYLGDTWVWDGSNWTQLHPASSPCPRAQAAMAYDPALGEVVLFGGIVVGGQCSDLVDGGSSGIANTEYANDTWAWNGTNWTMIQDGNVCDQSLGSNCIAFFGENGHAPYDGEATNEGLAFDAATGQLVLLANNRAGTPASNPEQDGTFVFSGSGWTQVAMGSATTPESEADIVYDSSDQQIVLLSGNASGSQCETWIWNGSWTAQQTASQPDSCGPAAGADDPALGGAVFYGGTGSQGCATTNDTWLWTKGNWVKLQTPDTPSAMVSYFGASMATDGNGHALLFGGGDCYSPSGQTFLLQGSMPAVSIAGVTVVEPPAGKTGTASFVVSLSAPSASPVSVKVSTMDGTAKAGAEYQQASQTITFLPNTTTATFDVNIIGGAFSSGRLSFSAVLSSPSGATIGTGSAQATLVAVSVSAIVAVPGLQPIGAGAARGGTYVQVQGAGFTGAEQVLFVPQDGAAAVPAAQMTVVSDTQINVTTPDVSNAVDSAGLGHAPNTNLPVDVVVQVPDGSGGSVDSSMVPADVFSFDVPVVGSVTPDKGPATGGETLTITGKYLSGADNVSFNGPNGQVQVVPLPPGSVQNDSTIAFPANDLTTSPTLAGPIQQTVDQGQPLQLGVAVEVPATGKPSYDELTSSADGVLTLVAFAVTSLSPPDGPLAPRGQPTLRISGVGFAQWQGGHYGQQQVLFQPRAPGLPEIEVTPTSVSDGTVAVPLPAQAMLQNFVAVQLASATPSLSFDVRVQADIGGVLELTPLTSADRYTVHLPQIMSVSVPPGCHPGSTVVLTGSYLSGATQVELTATGLPDHPVKDNGGRALFAISANPSDVSASFSLPDISDEASAGGGRLVMDVLVAVPAGPRYLLSNSTPGDKLTWDQSTGRPCGPAGLTIPQTITASRGGSAAIGTASCPANSHGCTVTASITAAVPQGMPDLAAATRAHRGARLLGKVKLRIRSGRTVTIRIKLSRRARALLHRVHKLKIVATIVLKPKRGKTLKLKRTAVLRQASSHAKIADRDVPSRPAPPPSGRRGVQLVGSRFGVVVASRNQAIASECSRSLLPYQLSAGPAPTSNCTARWQRAA